MDIYAAPALNNTETPPYGSETFQVVDEGQGGVIAYCHADNAERIVAALRALGSRRLSGLPGLDLLDSLPRLLLRRQVRLPYPGQHYFQQTI